MPKAEAKQSPEAKAPPDVKTVTRACGNCANSRRAPPTLVGSYGGRPPSPGEPTVSCLWLSSHRHDLAFAMVVKRLTWLGKGVGPETPDAMVVRAGDVCAVFEPR